MAETIAIIGAGNMGNCLITGLIQHGFAKENLWITDPSTDKLNSIKNKLDVRTNNQNDAAANVADVIIFAVKPQVFAAIAKALAPVVTQNKPLIISIAAGITTSSIEKWLGNNLPIIRSMPNTPALINCGATALFANRTVTNSQKALAEKILKAVGEVIWLQDESEMDIVTALSGSGPAYYFILMEALESAAIKLGLKAEHAHFLTAQTAYGAACMAKQSDASFQQLRKNVTSPGGTTEKAISVLEKKELMNIFFEALTAAKTRSEELAKEFGE